MVLREDYPSWSIAGLQRRMTSSVSMSITLIVSSFSFDTQISPARAGDARARVVENIVEKSFIGRPRSVIAKIALHTPSDIRNPSEDHYCPKVG